MKAVLLAGVLALCLPGLVLAEPLRLGAGGVPPYVNEMTGRGIVPDVIREALALSGYEIEVIFLPVTRSQHDFEIGAIDATSGGFTSDAPDVPQFRGEPSHDYEDYLFALEEKGLRIEEPKDLDGLAIATFPTAAKIYPDWLKKPVDEGRVLEVSDQMSELTMLNAGRIDVAVADANIMAYLIGRYSEVNGSETKSIVPVAKIGFISNTPTFRDEAVRDAYNAGLVKLKASGRYDEIIRENIEGKD